MQLTTAQTWVVVAALEFWDPLFFMSEIAISKGINPAHGFANEMQLVRKDMWQLDAALFHGISQKWHDILLF